MTLHEWLVKKEACPEAQDWIRAEHPDATLAELWDVCPRADWMIWALSEAEIMSQYWPKIKRWLDDVIENAAAEEMKEVVVVMEQTVMAATMGEWEWVEFESPWIASSVVARTKTSAELLRQANSLREAIGNPFTGWSPGGTNDPA